MAEPMSDFVVPAGDRLPLSGDGRWIDVKHRLTHGEREDMFARMRGPNGEWNHVRTVKVTTYLLGWSLVDLEGKPVPMGPTVPDDERLSTLRNLDPDAFDEINDAIEAHEKAVQAARDAQKKTAGTSGLTLISTSPAASAGATNG